MACNSHTEGRSRRHRRRTRAPVAKDFCVSQKGIHGIGVAIFDLKHHSKL